MLELFITGVDENSDKIFVTAGITAVMQSFGYLTAVYKPIETGIIVKNGFIQSRDLAFVKFVDPYIKTYFSYLLQGKSSPLIAAAEEKIIIEKNSILKDYQKIEDKNEILVVDGSWGLGTPLGKNFLEEDLITILDMPLLLVVSAVNSSVNNIIMAINHAKEKGIKLRGIILTNYPETTDNPDIKLLPKMIEEYTDTKILGFLPPFDKNNFNPSDLVGEILNGIDIEAVFQIQIAKLHY